MHKRVAAVEMVGLAKQDHLHAQRVGVLYLLDATEPYDIDHALAVGKDADQSAFGSFAFSVKSHEMTSDLNVGHLIVELRNLVEARTVDMPKRKVIDKLSECLYLQLVCQQFGSCFTNAFKVFYVGIVQPVHCYG